MSKSTTSPIGKKELISKISLELAKSKNKLTHNQINAVIEELLTQIEKSLIAGQVIRLLGYFSLHTTITKPRVAMNLQTKKKITVPAKRVPKMKFSQSLKEKIEKKSEKKPTT